MLKKYRKIGIMLGLIVVVSAVLVNPWVQAYAKDRYQKYQLFTKVLNLVQQYYVEPVDVDKLISGGIKGMLSELDPHTNYLPKEIYKEFESETSGEFGGIGIEITVVKGLLTIISPIEDTPAWRAGIKPGDKVVSIDGTSTKGFNIVEAAEKMRGKNGSVVKLGIYREDFEEPKVFSIRRGVVKIKSVKTTDLGDGYGYIRLTSFVENSANEMRKSIDGLIKKHKSIKGLIFDLRRNPGVILDQAVKISDMFLSAGKIVSTIPRNKKEENVKLATFKNTYKKFPLIVLINEYSASASEIVAAALQDNKRALIMGVQSFGKGSVQSVVKLSDGSGLKLTIARFYTPKGRAIQSEGVTPDVELHEIDEKAIAKGLKKKSRVKREKDTKGHLLSAKERNKNNKKSDQLFEVWWKSDGTKKKLTVKEKLLKKDFVVYQAYNYLRAWKTMKTF